MHILFDIRPLQNNYAGHGVGTFVRNIASRLVKSPVGASMTLCGHGGRSPLAACRYARIYRPSSHEWFWEQALWPVDILRLRGTMFHSTASLGALRDIGFPLLCPVRSVATVYDLNFLKIPGHEYVSRTKSFTIQRRALRKAGGIITISEYVKRDLCAQLDIPEERVSVVSCAVDDAVRAGYDRVVSDAPFTERTPYLLAMGETENKNITTVIAVFEKLAAAGFDGSLRVIGDFELQTQKVKTDFYKSPVKNRIVFTGRLTADALVNHYARCAFFIFPSLCEGFGLPVLEAMYCGAPVLCSNTTSLPEAGGKAALYCAPGNVEGFAALGERLLNDAEFRAGRVQAGKKNCDSFSWDAAARRITEIYEKLS